MGDHRAADRVRARGGDPAPADRARSAAAARTPGCATCPTPARDRRAGAGAAGVVRPRAHARARAAPRGARGRRGPRRPRRPRAGVARGCWRSPSIGPLDARDARALRPGPLRPRPGRRPRLPQARRAPHAPATRRRAPTRPRCAGSSSPTGSGRGWPASTCAAPPRAGLLTAVRGRRPASSPSPGRNSLVSAAAASGGRLSSPLLRHPVAVGAPTRPGPASRTACRVSAGKNTGSVALTTARLEPAVEARVGLQQRVDADLRVARAGACGRARWPAGSAAACEAPSSSRSLRRATKTSSS